MCGFVGGAGSNFNEFVKANILHLAKRGPDNQGVTELQNGIVFGATRLAMTDLNNRSNQPMINDTNGDILVFNGEVYNFMKIKKQLIASGISFKTESDTEVVLKLMSVFGQKSLPLLQGMFAFAFYNKKENTILLVRDFLGKKPLYYSSSSRNFVFSSSLNLIKRTLHNPTIDENSLLTYLRLGYTIDPKTIYSEIFSVQPGECIYIDMNSFRIESQFYFSPEVIGTNENNSIQDILDQEIQNRVVGHSKFAISLSGGLDSSVIAQRCSYLGFHPTAYSLSFKNSDKVRYSEDAKSAELIAKKLNLDFNLVQMPPASSIPILIDNFVKALEEPFANPTGLSMMVLYSAMSANGERLVLTGDGGDEVFGGYERYNKAKSISSLPEVNWSYLRSIYNDGRYIPEKIRKLLVTLLPANSSEFWLFWHQLTTDFELKKLNRFRGTENLDSYVQGTLRRLFSNNGRVSELMIKDLTVWLSMESNRKLDRISMWNSIEARSPFQSERLLNFGHLKLKESGYKTLNKSILRHSIDGLDSIPTQRNKAGFISPLGYWLRGNSELIIDSLEFLKRFTLFDENRLNTLSLSVKKNKHEDFKSLWSLIILANWLRYSEINIKSL